MAESTGPFSNVGARYGFATFGRRALWWRDPARSLLVAITQLLQNTANPHWIVRVRHPIVFASGIEIYRARVSFRCDGRENRSFHQGRCLIRFRFTLPTGAPFLWLRVDMPHCGRRHRPIPSKFVLHPAQLTTEPVNANRRPRRTAAGPIAPRSDYPVVYEEEAPLRPAHRRITRPSSGFRNLA
jgi:hypothetical protein